MRYASNSDRHRTHSQEYEASHYECADKPNKTLKTTSGTEEMSLGIPEILGALHLEYVHQQSGSVEEYSIPLKSPAAVPW